MANHTVISIGIEWVAAGHIAQLWNLGALSRPNIAGMPIEEILFGAAFGAYSSSVYEHFTWRRLAGRITAVATAGAAT